MRRGHLLTDQLPGDHDSCSICVSVGQPGETHIVSEFTLLHTPFYNYRWDRSMMVGYVPTIHTFSFTCNNHIDMMVHTPAFYELGFSYQMFGIGPSVTPAPITVVSCSVDLLNKADSMLLWSLNLTWANHANAQFHNFSLHRNKSKVGTKRSANNSK